MFRSVVCIPKTFVRIAGRTNKPKLIAGVRTNQHQLFLRYFADVPAEHPENHIHDHDDKHPQGQSKKEIEAELLKKGENHDHHHHKHKLLHVHDDLSHNAEELQNLLQSDQNIGVAKASAAVYSHSQALLSDAVHTLSDLLADLVTLYCIHVSRRAPSSKYPYGPGKVENMGALFVSATLLGSSAALIMHAINSWVPLLNHESLHGITDISFTTTTTTTLPILSSVSASSSSTALELCHSVEMDPNHLTVALLAAGASIATKEWIFRITRDAAVKTRSPVLMANAWHHRTDGMSSIVAIVGILGALVGFPLIDSIGSAIVATTIGTTGYKMWVKAFLNLIDRGPKPETVSKLSDIIKKNLKDEYRIKSLDVRSSGGYYQVVVKLYCDDDTKNLEDFCADKEELRSKIMKERCGIQRIDFDLEMLLN